MASTLSEGRFEIAAFNQTFRTVSNRYRACNRQTQTQGVDYESVAHVYSHLSPDVFFWRFADRYKNLHVIGAVAALAILWYVMIYDTPSNRAHRAFDHSVEKRQTKMQQTFQPERKKMPEGWEAIKVGVSHGVRSVAYAFGISDEKPEDLSKYEVKKPR